MDYRLVRERLENFLMIVVGEVRSYTRNALSVPTK